MCRSLAWTWKILADELAHHALVIDHLQDEVRRIEVQTEIVIRDDLPHLAPDGRRAGQVVTARPFVIGEEHRAVLDGDLDAAFPGELDDRRPDPGIILQVLWDGLILVLSDECADHRNLQQCGRFDHLLQDDQLPSRGARIADGADLDSTPGTK